ncbi:hypothetical protein PVAP13_1NG212300 [Panicum virgatum]|uniref:Uncharacterized protein n=1 Tax=Panicum virgatum TaxID=38727 RepID=A0A8T0WPK4_PANVG|nr:hypothetical protein PVAP13_1NG212300 [Panicum virgatum]
MAVAGHSQAGACLQSSQEPGGRWRSTSPWPTTPLQIWTCTAMLEIVSRHEDVMVNGVVRGTSGRRALASLCAPQPDDSRWFGVCVCGVGWGGRGDDAWRRRRADGRPRRGQAAGARGTVRRGRGGGAQRRRVGRRSRRGRAASWRPVRRRADAGATLPTPRPPAT